MNFQKLFNFKYIWQNIKKSKAVIILIFLLFTVLTSCTIILNSKSIITLTSLSVIATIGMVIPVILSYVCYGFVYKRKTIDFINSMPISRKNIFMSNTILGLILITLLISITSLSILITSNIVGAILPSNVVLDYFILWTVVYIFIFTVSNLAMSVSGNEITTIVVSLLILFFIPFVNDFITMIRYNESSIEINLEEKCEPGEFPCTNFGDKVAYLHTVQNNNTTNFVYNRLRSFFFGWDNLLFKSKQIFLMIILTIIYTMLGYYLFNKKKMEISETSFKSYSKHTLVKCLTITPFMLMFFEILLNEKFSVGLVIFFIVMLGYYYVYDLITKKGIESIKKSVLYFIEFSLVCFSIIYLVDYTKENKIKYTLDDIDGVSIDGTNFTLQKTKSKELIKILFKNKNLYGTDKVAFYIGNKKIVNTIALSSEDAKEIKKLSEKENFKENFITYEPKDAIAIVMNNRVYNMNDFPDINFENKNDLKRHTKNFYYYDKIKHVVSIYSNNISDSDLNYIYKVINSQNIDKLSKSKINSIKLIYAEEYDKDKIKYYGNVYQNKDLIIDYLKNIKNDNVNLNNKYILFNIYINNEVLDIIEFNYTDFENYLKSKNFTAKDIFDNIENEEAKDTYEY